MLEFFSVLASSNMICVVLGLFIGAVLVQYVSYHWVFWFASIFSIPVALGCLFIIPPDVVKSKDGPGARGAKWKSLDLTGISILTSLSLLSKY